jgi:hypothetical protein
VSSRRAAGVRFCKWLGGSLLLSEVTRALGGNAELIALRVLERQSQTIAGSFLAYP